MGCCLLFVNIRFSVRLVNGAFFDVVFLVYHFGASDNKPRNWKYTENTNLPKNIMELFDHITSRVFIFFPTCVYPPVSSPNSENAGLSFHPYGPLNNSYLS